LAKPDEASALNGRLGCLIACVLWTGAIGQENFPTWFTRQQGRLPGVLDGIHSSCCDMNYMFTVEKSKIASRFGKWAGNA